MKLLGHRASINVRKVLWTCAELDLPLEHDADWGGRHGRSLKDPAFVALNPFGLVPVLQDGTTVLRESNTICRYLADRAGRGDLLPPSSSPAARAAVAQWMDWQATDLNTAWRVVFLARARGSEAHARDVAGVAASIAAWHRHMQLLESQLAATKAHVAGDAFTLADILLGLSALRWQRTPMNLPGDAPRPALPAVSAWLSRLQTRAGFQRFGDAGEA